MKVLVLGGYGLIGSAVTRDLLACGYKVVGLGRNPKIGKSKFPSAVWLAIDLQNMSDQKSWMPYLKDVDAVINCSGALQEQANVSLEALHVAAVNTLVDAMQFAGVKKLVQVSAVGALENATTGFLCTKAKADAYIASSNLDWTIVRPGLVLSSDTFGGSTVLRMAAAMPLLHVRVYPDSKVQTVHVDEVATVIVQSLTDEKLSRQSFDLVERVPTSLDDLTLAMRSQMGNQAPRVAFTLPHLMMATVAGSADLVSKFGWHTGLRRTALKVLESGVTGDAGTFEKLTGQGIKSAKQTTANIGLGAQDLLFGRIQLVLAPAIALFGAFWLISGAVGLLSVEAAVASISQDFGEAFSRAFVVGGSLVDMLIGIGLLIRKYHVGAVLASALVSLVYLIAGTSFTPELWVDPLGPLVKIIPVLITSFFLLAARPVR